MERTYYHNEMNILFLRVLRIPFLQMFLLVKHVEVYISHTFCDLSRKSTGNFPFSITYSFKRISPRVASRCSLHDNKIQKHKKYHILECIDDLWTANLQKLSDLRSSIQTCLDLLVKTFARSVLVGVAFQNQLDGVFVLASVVVTFGDKKRWTYEWVRCTRHSKRMSCKHIAALNLPKKITSHANQCRSTPSHLLRPTISCTSHSSNASAVQPFSTNTSVSHNKAWKKNSNFTPGV